MATAPLRSPSLSERLYRDLLWLYPASFRRSYGCEMVQTFRDCYREERARGGALNIARLWSLVLSDLITTVCIEYWKTFITFFKSLTGLEKEFLMTSTILNLDVAQYTHIGHRASNEDNMTLYIPEDPQIMAKKGALFVVADGMGGHAKGDVASELAVNTIRDTYYQDTNEDILTSLRLAVEHANMLIWQKNEEILRYATSDEQKKMAMGTTCVATVLKNDKAHIANVGDSLVYVIHAGQVSQIAQSHELTTEQLRKGEITEEEAKKRGLTNKITRCLGEKSTVDVYVATETVQDGDTLILCTDGLWTLIEESEMCSIVEQYEPQESAKRLVARANENGGPDNITAVVVRVSLQS
ncbi:MAG TPA: protein phosphatase 2C domain-containing protein [Ktedonosporobacter sp.]|jgi:protein phosphatase|nr:protein phosphatase 2C domain-containing protein [Ktedonosporobacter sp.]